jgi:multidrug efflux pump subunit AcrA (membrane-fusion protein)
VELHLQHHPNALAIPPAALVPSNNGQDKAVFVIDSGKAKLVPVKTGIDDGLWVEVLDGLGGEEDVVVVGKSGLTDGQAVQPSAYNLPTGKSAKQKM